LEETMLFLRRLRSTRRLALAAALVAAVGLAAATALSSRSGPPASGALQNQSSEQVSEVVANLAAGHVTLIAAHDGVVIATIGSQFEPGDLAPLVLPTGERNVAILLGAVDWVRPPRNQPVLQLDARLPGLINTLSGGAPRLSSNTNFQQLDRVALQVLEPLRTAAHGLHAHLQMPENLPLVELVLVHQPVGDTPSVWDLSYWLRQTFLQENFWDTEVERPRVTALFPSKTDVSGLLEIRYPPDDRSPGLLDWLSHPTGRLAQAVETDPEMAKAQRHIADGEGRKARLANLVPLVKTALESMAPPSTGRALGVLDWRNGFAWVIKPPPRKTEKQRPSGAPSLRKPHP
jgi:hypothetical protein